MRALLARSVVRARSRVCRDRAAYLLLGRIAVDGPGRLSTLAGDLCVDLSVVSRQVAGTGRRIGCRGDGGRNEPVE